MKTCRKVFHFRFFKKTSILPKRRIRLFCTNPTILPSLSGPWKRTTNSWPYYKRNGVTFIHQPLFSITFFTSNWLLFNCFGTAGSLQINFEPGTVPDLSHSLQLLRSWPISFSLTNAQSCPFNKTT